MWRTSHQGPPGKMEQGSMGEACKHGQCTMPTQALVQSTWKNLIICRVKNVQVSALLFMPLV